MCDWLASPDSLELAAQVSFAEYGDFADRFLLLFLAYVHTFESSTSAGKCFSNPARRCLLVESVELRTSCDPL